MKKILWMLAIAGAVACSSDKNGETENTTEEKTLSTTPDQERSENALSDHVVNHYLEIKNALVNSDLEKASKVGEQFLAQDQRDDIVDQLEAPVQRIIDAANLDEAREAFFEYSNLMTDFVISNGANITLYKQFCPMAFNNSGAFWLSSEEEILNPYFGDKMLRCGEVQETF